MKSVNYVPEKKLIQERQLINSNFFLVNKSSYILESTNLFYHIFLAWLEKNISFIQIMLSSLFKKQYRKPEYSTWTFFGIL